MASVPIHTCVMGLRVVAAAWQTLVTFIKQRETSVAVFVFFFFIYWGLEEGQVRKVFHFPA